MLSRSVLLLVCVFFATSSAQYNKYENDGGVTGIRNGTGLNLESPSELESTIQKLTSQLDEDRKNTNSNFREVRKNLEMVYKSGISIKNELRGTKQLVQELAAKVNLSITEIHLLRNEFGTLKKEQTNLKDDLEKFERELTHPNSPTNSRIRELANRLLANQNSLTSKIDGTRIAIKTLKNEQDTLKGEVGDANQQFRNQLQQLNAKLLELMKQKRWAVFTLENGKTYHFSLQKNTWDMAKKICEEKGMRLASPKTQEEISLLHQKLTELEPESGFWLSASDAANKGVEYQWLDGEVLPLNSSLWEKERLADDVGRGSASCVFIRKVLEDKLYKEKCTDFTNFICEMQ